MSGKPAATDPLKALVFPPMPDSLLRIRAAVKLPQPDLGAVVDAVSRDLSLAAEVLKTVNSPAFRRSRPLSSIPNAVMVLGADRVAQLAAGAALRASFGIQGAWMERFWEVAGDVALAMAVLARELCGLPPEKAYTFGLFHDSGIPLLKLRHPDYEETLKAAGRDPVLPVVVLEHRRFGLHHAAVGAHIAETWSLDPHIVQAIRLHHDYEEIREPRGGTEEEVVALVGLLKMAEQISNSFRGLAFRNVADDHEWDRVGAQVLQAFELSEVQFHDLADHIVDLLSER